MKTICIYTVLLINLSVFANPQCDIDAILADRDSIPNAAWAGNRILTDFKECYFGEADQSEWVTEVKKILVKAGDVKATEKIRITKLREAIDLTQNALMQENIFLPYRTVYRRDLTDWQSVLMNLKNEESLTYFKYLNSYTSTDNALKKGNVFDFNLAINENCQPAQWQVDKSNCIATMNNVVNSLRFFTASSQINKIAGLVDMQDVFTGLTKLDKQWTFYFDSTRPQNPLELYINSRRSKFNAEGFSKVPNTQIILLHPSIAMEYIDDAIDGSQFQESVILEVIGLNRWSWESDGKMKTPLGLSAIASYSDRSNIDDLGWGLMGHVNHKYSFGVTKRGDDTGFFVSVDLQQFFFKWTKDKKEKYDGYKDFINFSN